MQASSPRRPPRRPKPVAVMSSPGIAVAAGVLLVFVGGLVISWALIVAYFAASLIDAFSDEPASTWWQLALQSIWFWLGLVVATGGEILVYWGVSRTH